MVTMSQKEFQRVKAIENAAGLLQLSERQVQRYHEARPAPITTAHKRKSPTPRTYTLRPPSFNGRSLNARG
jgi:hypothetical protein